MFACCAEADATSRRDGGESACAADLLEEEKSYERRDQQDHMVGRRWR